MLLCSRHLSTRSMLEGKTGPITMIYAAMAVDHPTTSGLVYVKCSSCAYILQHLKGKGTSN